MNFLRRGFAPPAEIIPKSFLPPQSGGRENPAKSSPQADKICKYIDTML